MEVTSDSNFASDSLKYLRKLFFHPVILLIFGVIVFLYYPFVNEYWGNVDFAYYINFVPYPFQAGEVDLMAFLRHWKPFLLANMVISALDFSYSDQVYLRIALHCLNCLLLIHLVKIIFVSRNLALWTGFIFAIRSAHWETIRWLEGLPMLLLGALYLSSMILFLRFRQHNHIAWLAGAVSLWILSLPVHPLGAILPIALVLLESLVLSKRQKPAVSYWNYLLLTLSVIGVIFILMQSHQTWDASYFTESENFKLSRSDNMVNYVKWNFDILLLRKLVVLIGVFQKSPGNIFFALVYIVVMFILITHVAKGRHVFSILFFLLHLFPYIVMIGRFTPINIYIASIGFCLLFGELLEYLGSGRCLETKNYPKFFVISLLVVFLLINAYARKIANDDTQQALIPDVLHQLIVGMKDIYPIIEGDKALYIIHPGQIENGKMIERGLKLFYHNSDLVVNVITPKNAEDLRKIKEIGIERSIFFEFESGIINERPEINKLIKDTNELERLISVIKESG